MKRDEVITILREHRSDLERFDVKTLSLFGSVARNEATPASDVDLLVEFNGSVRWKTYCRLNEFLDRLLGINVDLVIRGGLRKEVIPYVTREEIRVA